MSALRPAPPVEVVADPALIVDLHASLLVPSFPPEERRDAATLVDDVAAGRCEVLATRASDGTWQSTAVGQTYPGSDVTLLVWLAVGASARAGGLGTRILRAALSRWYGAGAALVVAEAEHAGDPVRDPAYGDPAARVRFYARNGARLVDVPYRQPSLRPGLPAVPMTLLALPRPDDDLPAVLPGGLLAGFLLAYHRPRPGDADWAQTAAALDRPDVALHPLVRAP